MDEPNDLVIFICTGNYYRSRLAEELFNIYVQDTDLACEATSRGLIETNSIKGISPFTFQYLDEHGWGSRVDPTRNPMTLRVSDLEEARLLIALNKDEHEPMMRERFGQIPKILEEKGRLRYWNVCDVPGETNSITRFFGRQQTRATQSPESGTEHIDFAIQALIRELDAASEPIED